MGASDFAHSAQCCVRVPLPRYAQIQERRGSRLNNSSANTAREKHNMRFALICTNLIWYWLFIVESAV